MCLGDPHLALRSADGEELALLSLHHGIGVRWDEAWSQDAGLVDGRKILDWLAEHGFDKLMGARPMARVIQENIKRPLAEELLFGRLEGGGNVRIGVADDKLSFDFEKEAVTDDVEQS